MKWHIVCLIVIWWSLVYPTEGGNPSTIAQVLPQVIHTTATLASDHCTSAQFLWAEWQAIIWLYGACHFDGLSAQPGRVTLCRWQLKRWWSHCAKQKRRSDKQSASRPSSRTSAKGHSTSASARTAEATTIRAHGRESAQTVDPNSHQPLAKDEKTKRIPLRIVLRPGVMLTGKGIQLRPMIARLGQDVTEYIALWEAKDQFEAAIAHLLGRPCPLCEGTKGFERIGSTARSVIPPGSKERVWFRVQKVRCKDCQAITRILPTWCIPYKSHHAQTIQNVLENCWRRNNSYRDTTGILNQSRPKDGQYVGHTLPYQWTIWLGGLAIHLPQFLVWLGLQLPRHGLMDEYFMEQDNGTDNHRIFAVTVQDPESTAIWNIVRVDRNDTAAFKQTLQQLKQVGIRLRAITTDGWPAILRAVREELAETVHLLCYFHAKKNVYETLEKYRRAKKLSAHAPELTRLCRAFFDVLDAPNAKLYRARLRRLTKQVADEPILLARCQSLRKKSHYNTWRLRSPLLTATTSLVELSFKFLTRKVESMYSFRRSKCNAAQKSLIVWALVRNFVPYLPGAKHAGRSPAELAGLDLEGLPWLQYVNLKLSEAT
jgi:hypothetical protein